MGKRVRAVKEMAHRNVLLELYAEALRAWIRADKPGMPEALREKRLRQARELTGRAVDKGLLGHGKGG